VDINVPGSRVTGPLKINDRRRVVGIYVDAVAEPNPDGTAQPGAVHGFVWHDGHFETIDGTPDAAYTRALDINNRGRSAGRAAGVRRAVRRFVLRTDSSFRLPSSPPPVPSASTTAARSGVQTARFVSRSSNCFAKASEQSTRARSLIHVTERDLGWPSSVTRTRFGRQHLLGAVDLRSGGRLPAGRASDP
jgi:hypothetical protein